MTDRELMQQALEALTVYDGTNFESKRKRVLAALRERLVQPQRTHWEGCEEVHPECKKPETVMAEYKFQTYAAYKTDGEMKIGVVPEQEPFGYFQLDLRLDAWVQNRNSNKGVAFYTTPPRREWVGLTDDDLKPVCDEYRILFGGWVLDFARAIEAKLKEKNA